MIYQPNETDEYLHETVFISRLLDMFQLLSYDDRIDIANLVLEFMMSKLK